MTANTPENLKKVDYNTHCVAKGDTGATSHYWMSNNKNLLQNIRNTNEIPVQLPDSTLIMSSEKGELPLSSSLSSKAKTAMILPELKSSNLISLGQLCDDDCQIILDKHQMLALKITK